MNLLALYQPGASVLHRLPALVKLAGLVAAGIGVAFLDHPWQVGVAMVAVVCGYVLARLSLPTALRQVRPLLWVALLVGLFHVLVNGWERAVVVVGAIGILVLLASLVTLTTRTSDMVDAVAFACRPLRVIGLRPERVALLLSLGIRAVPVIVSLAERVRDAQRARGLTASPRAFAVPLVVGAIRHADSLGEALVARGVDD